MDHISGVSSKSTEELKVSQGNSVGCVNIQIHYHHYVVSVSFFVRKGDLHDDETPLGVVLKELFESLDVESTITHVHRAIYQPRLDLMTRA